MEPVNNTPIFNEQALNHLVAAIQDAVFIKDAQGRWLIANEAAKTLFQLYDIDWLNKTNEELRKVQAKECAIHDVCFVDDGVVWKDEKQQIVEDRINDVEGNLRTYEIRKSPIFKENGDINGVITIVRDITEIQQIKHDIRIADIAIESFDAIVITDADNRILRVNQSFTRLTGYESDEVVGRTPAILKSDRHDKTFYSAMWNTLLKEKFWQGEIWDRRKNGEVYPKFMRITVLTDDDGNIQNFIGAFSDLSQHKEATEAIHQLAFFDPLTNLPNRRLLNNKLKNALDKANNNQDYGAIMMIDVDHFKRINDTSGHAVGDLLLIEVASRLKSCVRHEDCVARLGGDEFVIMLEQLSKDFNQASVQATLIAEKILKTMYEPFLINKNEIHISLSIGLSIFTIPCSTSQEMLKWADTAMYQAKAAGRNTLRFFDPDLHATLERRMLMESELHLALSENQLELYYQAQVNQHNEVLGAEVLIRWNHPQQGMVQPNDFISIAEESGLILPIGNWVMLTACMQLKAWESHPATRELTLAVNVSAKQFGLPNFVELVCEVLEDSGARATHLKLELTESLMLHNIKDAAKKMEALKLLGIDISIDDFGTGHSSLSYLKKLPIDQLKIDQTFVRDIDTDQCDMAIAKTIIDMAQTFGFDVIAEGVETETQRNILKAYGCLSYQGYFFSKPVPLESFEKLIGENSFFKKS
jgi:diguanylate cyclase (GGDEF)-like protein/PAS domain S-box-containing protein